MLMRCPAEGDLTTPPPQTPPASVALMPGNPSFILHLPFPGSSPFQVLSQICSSVALSPRGSALAPAYLFSISPSPFSPPVHLHPPLFISLPFSFLLPSVLPFSFSLSFPRFLATPSHQNIGANNSCHFILVGEQDGIPAESVAAGGGQRFFRFIRDALQQIPRPSLGRLPLPSRPPLPPPFFIA